MPRSRSSTTLSRLSITSVARSAVECRIRAPVRPNDMSCVCCNLFRSLRCNARPKDTRTADGGGLGRRDDRACRAARTRQSRSPRPPRRCRAAELRQTLRRDRRARPGQSRPGICCSSWVARRWAGPYWPATKPRAATFRPGRKVHGLLGLRVGPLLVAGGVVEVGPTHNGLLGPVVKLDRQLAAVLTLRYDHQRLPATSTPPPG